MAGSVNKVILVGNLGRDPEVRRLGNGEPVVNLRVATSESWKDKGTGERKEKTEWHSVVIFNENLGRVAEQYLKKGSKVYIEGQLQTRKWQDQSGVEKYTTEIVLQRFRGELTILDSRGQGGSDEYGEGGGSVEDRSGGGGSFGRSSPMGSGGGSRPVRSGLFVGIRRTGRLSLHHCQERQAAFDDLDRESRCEIAFIRARAVRPDRRPGAKDRLSGTRNNEWAEAELSRKLRNGLERGASRPSRTSGASDARAGPSRDCAPLRTSDRISYPVRCSKLLCLHRLSRKPQSTF